VITIGSYGWFGYLGQFGLLTAPILLLGLRRSDAGITPASAGLAVVLAANLMYLVPTPALSSVGWLAAGALAALSVRTADSVPKLESRETAFPVWAPAGPAGPLTVRKTKRSGPEPGKHERHARP